MAVGPMFDLGLTLVDREIGFNIDPVKVAMRVSGQDPTRLFKSRVLHRTFLDTMFYHGVCCQKFRPDL